MGKMKNKTPKSKPQQKKPDWEIQDFVESVDGVMQEQEKNNPEIKQVHARLSPEWKQVSEKISKFLMAANEEEASKLREEIVSQGEISTRVLLDFLMSIKQQAKG